MAEQKERVITDPQEMLALWNNHRLAINDTKDSLTNAIAKSNELAVGFVNIIANLKKRVQELEDFIKANNLQVPEIK